MSIGHNTNLDIIIWVEKFILGQGGFPAQDDNIPHTIQDLVADQLEIRWWKFMEGWINTQFHHIQFCHMIHADTMMMATAWTWTFISKLLHITLSQWIFRNFMLHKKTHGILRMQEWEAILLHIEALSLSNKNDLPEDSQFLLEFDMGHLQQADFEMQCYWVAAVEAVCTALAANVPINVPPPLDPAWQWSSLHSMEPQ